MNSHHSNYLVLMGILVLTSTIVSSFRTNTVLRTALYPSKAKETTFFHLRGGSDAVPSTPLSTAGDLSASADDDVTAPTSGGEAIIEAPSNFGMGPKSSPPGILRSTFSSVPWQKFPNYLTYARCIAIPALVVQFYLDKSPAKNIHTSLIFSIASFTDYLDGYLARRWDITSAFGAFLDPVADKLMVSTMLILLSGKYGRLVAIPCAIILAREIAVSALREWMASMGLRDSVKVGFQGKLKTALTMVALTIVSALPDNSPFGRFASVWDVIATTGFSMLFLSALVTITSGSVYFKAAAPALMGEK